MKSLLETHLQSCFNLDAFTKDLLSINCSALPEKHLSLDANALFLNKLMHSAQDKNSLTKDTLLHLRQLIQTEHMLGERMKLSRINKSLSKEEVINKLFNEHSFIYQDGSKVTLGKRMFPFEDKKDSFSIGQNHFLSQTIFNQLKEEDKISLLESFPQYTLFEISKSYKNKLSLIKSMNEEFSK